MTGRVADVPTSPLLQQYREIKSRHGKGTCRLGQVAHDHGEMSGPLECVDQPFTTAGVRVENQNMRGFHCSSTPLLVNCEARTVTNPVAATALGGSRAPAHLPVH